MTVLPESHPVGRWHRMFHELKSAQPMPIDLVYDPDVTFEDPFRRIEGRTNLEIYFAKLNADIVSCTFTFGASVMGLADGGSSEGSAAVPWTMNLRLRRGPKAPITVSGMSHLRFHERVTYQRDYVDAGQMVYEHVPVLGSIIRRIKAKM